MAGQAVSDTRWTIVNQAKTEDPAHRKRALEDLCSAYWHPVYAFARSKGNSPADAEDLTQGFFRQPHGSAPSDFESRILFFFLSA